MLKVSGSQWSQDNYPKWSEPCLLVKDCLTLGTPGFSQIGRICSMPKGSLPEPCYLLHLPLESNTASSYAFALRLAIWPQSAAPSTKLSSQQRQLLHEKKKTNIPVTASMNDVKCVKVQTNLIYEN